MPIIRQDCPNCSRSDRLPSSSKHQSRAHQNTAGVLTKNAKRQFRKLEATLHPEAMLEKILAIREVSKTLYESLAATADCRCHRLNLELQGFLEESGPRSEPCRSVSTGPTATKLRLIMSNDVQTEDAGSTSFTYCDCTSIIINSEFETVSTKHVNVAPPKPWGTMDSAREPSKNVRFPSPTGGRGDDNKQNMEITSTKATIAISDAPEGSGKGTMSIELIPEGERVCISLRESGDKDTQTTTTVSTSVPLSITEVDNLCTLMRNLQPRNHPDECLGRISPKG